MNMTWMWDILQLPMNPLYNLVVLIIYSLSFFDIQLNLNECGCDQTM